MERSKMKNNIQDIVLTALFLLAITAVPLIMLLVPDRTFSETERRYLAERPSMTEQDLREWSFDDDFEEYAADQMPLRDLFVGLNALIIRGTGRQVSADIYADREGYLVEAPVSYSREETDRRLKKIASLGEKTGLVPEVVVVPSTGYVRSDNFPGHLAKLYSDSEVFTAVSSQEGVTDISLEETFLAHGSDWYYRTDHHWNREGAYAAYELWCKKTGREALPADAFLTHHVNGFSGSTRSRSALWLTRTETLYLYEPECRVTVRFSDDEKAYDSLLFLGHIGEYDWYPAFIDGNHPLTFIENEDSVSDDVLVMVKDSFGNTLAPWLVPSFKKIVMVDPRYYRGSISDICHENAATELMFCYSVERIANDTNLLLLK